MNRTAIHRPTLTELMEDLRYFAEVNEWADRTPEIKIKGDEAAGYTAIVLLDDVLTQHVTLSADALRSLEKYADIHLDGLMYGELSKADYEGARSYAAEVCSLLLFDNPDIAGFGKRRQDIKDAERPVINGRRR